MVIGRAILMASALCLAACATQRYGREVDVSDTEKRLLTCDQIEIEIAKNDEFLKSTAEQDSKFTDKKVLGFLGDFGIGNAMEYSDAMKSGTTRGQELHELLDSKGCTRSVVASQAPAAK